MESTATITREPGQDFDPSLVHTIETTARAPLPLSYQDFRARNHVAEHESALNLYCHFDNIEGTHRAENFLKCRQYAWFARHIKTGQVKVVSNSCRLRWCPICAEAKTNIIRHNVQDWIKSVNRPKFFTLTVQHSNEPLLAQVERIYKQFRRFRQHKVIKKAIRGGVWFFQVTYRKKTKQWHPHLHCVLDANYIDHRTLSQEWFLTTGNSFVVDIRAVKDPQKAANEVAKYASRPCKLSKFELADQTEIFSAFFGKRFCGSWGTGRKIILRKIDIESHNDWQRLPTWSVVIENRYDRGPHQSILKAWLTSSPLELAAVADVIYPVPFDVPTPLLTLTIIETKQFVFKEFR